MLNAFCSTYIRENAERDIALGRQSVPDGINIAHIASGRYDGYLSSYAAAVHAYRHPVIVSFGHEMNGSWSSEMPVPASATTIRAGIPG